MPSQSGEECASGLIGKAPGQPLRRLNRPQTKTDKGEGIPRQVDHRLQKFTSQSPPVVDERLHESPVSGAVFSNEGGGFSQGSPQRNRPISSQRMGQWYFWVDPFESMVAQR